MRQQKYSFTIKKLYKLIVILILFIIVFLVVSLLVLGMPIVQSRLALHLTQKINHSIQSEIKVEGVSIEYDGAVNLSSFFLADHHSDTLFYAKNFKTDLYSLGQWVDGNLFFSTTEFEDVYLKIIKYEGEENNSLSLFTQKLLSHSAPKDDSPSVVRLDHLNITEGRFLMMDNNNQKKSLQLDQVRLQAQDLFIVNDGLEVSLQKMSFVSTAYGAVNLSETELYYHPCTLDISNFKLSSGKSLVEGNFNLLLSDNDPLEFQENTSIQLDLKTELSREELKYFADLSEDFQPLKMNVSAKGTLKDFEFYKLEVNQNVLQFNAKLHLKEAFSEAPIQANFDFQDLNFRTSELKKIFPSKFLDRIPEPVFSYPELRGRGALSLRDKTIKTSFQLQMGNASMNHSSQFRIGFEEKIPKLTKFEGVSIIENLDLSPWNKKWGAISSVLNLSAHRVSKNDLNVNLDLKLNEIEFNNKTFKNITIKGDLKPKGLQGSFSIKDQYISAAAGMAFSWEDPQHKYQFDLNLDQLNLHLFNAELGGGKAVYSGDLNLFLVGNTFDDLQGNLLFKNIRFENQLKRDSFNDFILETNLIDQKRSIKTINSDIMDIKIEGEFQLTKLKDLFSNAFAEAFPFVQKKKIEKSQDLVYDISVETNHLTAVFPKLYFDKKAVFRGILSTKDNVSKMTLNIPKIVFNGINTENIELQLDNQNPLFNTYMSLGKIQNDSFTLLDFNTLGVKRADTLNFRTEFSSTNQKTDLFELNYSLIVDENRSLILLKPSHIEYENNHWILNPKSDKNHLISFDPIQQSISLNHILVEQGEERIELRGSYQSLQNYQLSLNMDKVLLQNLALSTEKFNLKGAMNLSLDIQRSPTLNGLQFNGSVDDFILNDLDMGSLRFFTSGNTQLNSYGVNLIVSNQAHETLSINGNILGFDQSPRLDLNFNFDDFDLSFLNPVVGESVNHIRGEVSGNVNLWGPLDTPKHIGQLILHKGGLGIPEINTDYRIADGTEISLTDQSFKFNTTDFHDTLYNTKAVVEGVMRHTNFLNWAFDFSIVSDRILMLNMPEKEDEIFFGEGFLGGKVHLYGPSNNLTIDVVGSSEKGTSIKIPWADDYGLADTSFIEFINKNKKNKTQASGTEDSNKFSGLRMNFELDVNENAEIKVVIDKESGSFLSGRGAGNILMEIDTNGKFNMFGDFITYEGIYNFKNLGVIDKKFNLKPGGTIVWEGDPLGAQMDLEAVYNVPGGANPALLLDNPNFNRKIPTEVLIRLQGNLLKPDDPIFEIDFPNTSAVFTSEINYRLSDPQISQLQAISLLSQGIFINEVSVSVQGITNNLYEKASDLFSNLLGDDQGKLQVGVNYLQGDKSRLLDVNSEDRLGLTLSTQITDKILLNGKIGVPVGGIEETLIVGDIQIDFILNEEGSLKAKVFNKENEFRYIGDELGYTQGVGLSYQVDFETFRELLTKIVKGQSDKAFQKQLPVSDPTNTVINFINKK